MRKPRILITVIVLLTLIGGAIPAAGQDQPSPLLEMLGLVPDSELVHDSNGWATVRFTDFQAFFIAEGVDELRETVPVETLLETMPVIGLSRLVAAPRGLQYILAVAGQMDQLVGFEWFEDAITSLEFGQPPAEGLILGGDFDADAIGAALSAREPEPYQLADVNGVTVWHRFDDNDFNPSARAPGDPFGGELGAAARIAVLPGYVANARTWTITEAMIAAAQDEQDSLADNPNYRALAEAITAPDGVLIQALFFNLADLGFIPGDPARPEIAEQATADYGPLMPYALAALADRQDGSDQVHIIALVYPDAAIAAQAADELTRRVRAFTLRGTNTAAVEEYGAVVSGWVYESDTGAVAVVEVRYPLPENRIDEKTGMFTASGRMYWHWINALMRREFFVLQVK